MNQKLPTIGIFDSGVGGLSILQELVKLNNQQHFPPLLVEYFADNAFCPYGEKTEEQILERVIGIVDFFVDKHVNIIVLACNTVTAVAIETLRKNYPLIKFVGIEPAVKPAAEQTLTNVIGVLATKRTLNSARFLQKVKELPPEVIVKTCIGTHLATMVEEGEENSIATRELLSAYITPMLYDGIDQLVLGCTHYPFFLPIIRQILPSFVTIHNPAPAVAKRILSLLDIPINVQYQQQGIINVYTSASSFHMEMRCHTMEFPEEIVCFYPNTLISTFSK